MKSAATVSGFFTLYRRAEVDPLEKKNIYLVVRFLLASTTCGIDRKSTHKS
jgi:hypothetical protein